MKNKVLMVMLKNTKSKVYQNIYLMNIMRKKNASIGRFKDVRAKLFMRILTAHAIHVAMSCYIMHERARKRRNLLT